MRNPLSHDAHFGPSTCGAPCHLPLSDGNGTGQQLRSSCGVVWFVHVSRCGGTAFRERLASMGSMNGWYTYDLGQAPDVRQGQSHWNQSWGWRKLLSALRAPLPRLILHQHDGMLPAASDDAVMLRKFVRCSLALRSCRLTLVVVLREPTARALSHSLYALSHKWLHSAWRQSNARHLLATQPFRESNSSSDRATNTSTIVNFAALHTNYMTKYLTLGDYRMWSSTSPAHDVNESYSASLAPRAMALLSEANLVGRTEELDATVDALATLMRWRRPVVAHERTRGMPSAPPAVLAHSAASQLILHSSERQTIASWQTTDRLLYSAACQCRDAKGERVAQGWPVMATAACSPSRAAAAAGDGTHHQQVAGSGTSNSLGLIRKRSPLDLAGKSGPLGLTSSASAMPMGTLPSVQQQERQHWRDRVAEIGRHDVWAFT